MAPPRAASPVVTERRGANQSLASTPMPPSRTQDCELVRLSGVSGTCFTDKPGHTWSAAGPLSQRLCIDHLLAWCFSQPITRHLAAPNQIQFRWSVTTIFFVRADAPPPSLVRASPPTRSSVSRCPARSRDFSSSPRSRSTKRLAKPELIHLASCYLRLSSPASECRSYRFRSVLVLFIHLAAAFMTT